MVENRILFVAEIRTLDDKFIRIVTIFDNLECFQQDNRDYKTSCIYDLKRKPESMDFIDIMDILCQERDMYNDDEYKYRCVCSQRDFDYGFDQY